MKTLILILYVVSLGNLCNAQTAVDRGARTQYQEVYELRNDTLQTTKRIYQEFDKKGNLQITINLMIKRE